MGLKFTKFKALTAAGEVGHFVLHRFYNEVVNTNKYLNFFKLF